MIQNDTVNLDAYFNRIGYKGPREPTLPVLEALHRLHPQAIPFENIDPILRRPVRLDSPSIEAKLVRGGRGGYCFEHNLLFMRALRSIGFRVSGLGARVLWGRPDDAETMRSHMLIRVEIEGATYLADVGFGIVTLTGPLLFAPGIEQQTPHEPFRIVEIRGGYKMQVRIEGEWRTLYRFDLQEQFPIDYEVANYYVSTNPNSIFVGSLMIARATEEGRLGLMNNELTVHALGAGTQRRKLPRIEKIEGELESRFGIILPERERLRETLRRLLDLR